MLMKRDVSRQIL